jgi:hypothetical protein
MAATKLRIGFCAIALNESLEETFPAEKSRPPFAEPEAEIKKQAE